MIYTGESDTRLFLDFLQSNGHQMRSCSALEIEQLSRLAKNKRLPLQYLELMRRAGNGIRLFIGSSYTIGEVPELREAAIELLQENNSDENLADSSFVFFMHQGYQFYYFNLDDGDNPPVYFYNEGENEDRSIKRAESFSNFLIDYYNETEMFYKSRGLHLEW
jgi:hypothetical protein